MSTERMNLSPVMLRRVLAERLWGERDFFLIDVGASGGIEAHWHVFGARLRAVGFEPLLAEAARLREEARGSRISYEAAFVTCRDYDVLFPPAVRQDRLETTDNNPFQRVSALRALELLRLNYEEQIFNAGAPLEHAQRRVTLDDWLPTTEHDSVDFIKIDTDGHDIEVLLGADRLLRAGGALGLSIELQFHGAHHEYANVFANIDRFVRGHGFSLFDLDTYRYSRATLPAPFVYDVPAQTRTGQVMWGEGVYFRDLAHADYERMWSYEPTQERVLKLACLFEMFGLPDCAAELLLRRRDVVGAACDSLLDDLAGGEGASPGAYAELVRRFESDPTAWYASRQLFPEPGEVGVPADSAAATAVQETPGVDPPISRVDESTRPGDQSPRRDELKAKIARLRKKLADAQDRLRRRDERIARLTRRLEEARPGKS